MGNLFAFRIRDAQFEVLRFEIMKTDHMHVYYILCSHIPICCSIVYLLRGLARRAGRRPIQIVMMIIIMIIMIDENNDNDDNSNDDNHNDNTDK